MFIEFLEDYFASISSIQCVVNHQTCSENNSECLGVHIFLKEEPEKPLCSNFKSAKDCINVINKLSHDKGFNNKLNEILEK